jgi:hypothetical protein
MVDASLFCAAPIPYRISTLKSRTSNLPKIEVLEFPAPPRMRKRPMRRANLSTFKYQISNLPIREVLESLHDFQTRKWLKISGGGGTQPYSSTHRIRACPAVPLASI